MTRFIFGLLLLSLSCHLACTRRWAASQERLEQECGRDIRGHSAERYIKVLEPTGTELDTAAIYEMSAILSDQNSEQNLPVSSKGCLALPKGRGQINMQVLKRNWAAVKPLVQETLAPKFEYLTLEEPPVLQLQLDCPADGVLSANKRLNQVLRIQSQGQPELFAVELRARDEEGRETTLFAKSLGERDWKIEEELSVESLSEKLYTLVAYQQDLSRSSTLTAGPSCGLAILRQPPEIDGTRTSAPIVVKEDEILPWTSSQAKSQTYVCREPYSVQASSSGEQCRPSFQCKDAASFQEENLIRAKDAGLWSYYLYAEDAAGNRSSLVCQTVIVSTSKPVIDIQWRDPLLKHKITPLLRDPRPLLSLDINVFHPTVPQDILAKNVECRAELVVKGLGVHPGKEVRCLSGACRDKTLETFQPCQSDLEISIADVLNEPNLLDAKLRILARVSDGAGRTAEAGQELWLRKTLWGITQFSTEDQTPMGASNLFNQIVALDNERVLASTFNQTLLWQNESWVEITSPFDRPVKSVSMEQLNDGSIIARFILEMGDQDISTFAIFVADQWQPIEITGWDSRNMPCSIFKKLDSGELSCTSSGLIVRFRPEKVLEKIETMEAFDGGPCRYLDTNEAPLRSQTGIWYLACPGGLLTIDPSGQLKNVELPLDKTSIQAEAKEFDAEGRLWIILNEQAGRPIRIGYVEGTKFTEVVSPIKNQPSYSSLSLARNAKGTIQFQSYVWDETTKTWLQPDRLRKLFQNGPVRVDRLSRQGLIYENASFVMVEQGQSQQFFPKRGLGVFQFGYVKDVAQSKDGSLWLLYKDSNYQSANLFRFQTSSFLNWGSSSFNLPNEDIQSFYRGRGGAMTVQLRDSGFYSFVQGRWEKIAENPESSAARTYLDDEGLWVASANRLLGFNKGISQWEMVWEDDEFGNYSSPWISERPARTFWKDGQGRRWFVKYDGIFITEWNGQWEVLDPLGWNAPRNNFLEGDRDEFSFPDQEREYVEAVGMVDGSLIVASRQAIYKSQGKTFERLPLTDWNFTSPVSGIESIGEGWFRVTSGEDGSKRLIDIRSPLNSREWDLSHVLKRQDGEFVKATIASPSHPLVLVTDRRVLLENKPKQWSTILEFQELRKLLGDDSLRLNSSQEVWLDEEGSLWLIFMGGAKNEIIQVFLPQSL